MQKRKNSKMSDLTELFTRDPYSLNTIDLERIIAVFRERRANYKLGNITPKTKPKAKPTLATPEDGFAF